MNSEKLLIKATETVEALNKLTSAHSEMFINVSGVMSQLARKLVELEERIKRLEGV